MTTTGQVLDQTFCRASLEPVTQSLEHEISKDDSVVGRPGPSRLRKRLQSGQSHSLRLQLTV